MTDNGLAALAAALRAEQKRTHDPEHGSWAFDEGQDTIYDELLLREAAAILGERGVFLPDGHPLGVEDAIAQGQARIATLDARIVDLNGEVLTLMTEIATLRAALDGLAEAAEAVWSACEPSWSKAYRGERMTPVVGQASPSMVALRAALAAAKEAGNG